MYPIDKRINMELKDIMQEIDSSQVDYYVNHMHLNAVETKIHQHTKGQLLYAEGGIVHIFVEEKHWYLPARCFMWIPADTKHSILTYSKKVDLFNIYFSTEEEEDYFYAAPNIYFANDLLREMIFYTSGWFGKILIEDRPKYYFLKALKANLPSIESTKLPIMMQHPFPKDPKLFEIATFLSNNLDSNYTIDQIAQRFGLSTRTLSRKFKENLGMNYVRFLRSLRITKAFQLIAEQQNSMYEIAFKVGYGSLAAFSNIFLKIAGIRPSDYAKLLSRNKGHRTSI